LVDIHSPLDATMRNTLEMELTADGLTLRPPQIDDVPAVVAAVRSSLRELSPWMPWATSTYGEDEARTWMSGALGDVHPFVMIDADDELVGSCGLNKVDEFNRSANLGYWVRSDRSGRGHATTATELLKEYGFAIAGLHRMEVIMSVRNHASRRVAEKSGAVYEGVARGALRLGGEFHDTHVWSFVAE
jgi:ribosomal-protein-serine acetyltransferase